MAQDHFQNPPDHPKAYKNQKDDPKKIHMMMTISPSTDSCMIEACTTYKTNATCPASGCKWNGTTCLKQARF